MAGTRHFVERRPSNGACPDRFALHHHDFWINHFMLSEIKSASADALQLARSQIRLGEIPTWVEECSYDLEFKGEEGSHTTDLLTDRQINTESNEDFIRVAIRLETLDAVQHLSQ